MPKYAHIVMGPAGSGKSSYCAVMQQHLRVNKRECIVVNCDPAAEHFTYAASKDIRDIIQLEDVTEDDELKLGPNGGLIFCMEYLVKNMGMFLEEIEPCEEDYFLFDFPGQIELYTHLDVMRRFVDALKAVDFRVCGVFLVDAQFLGEPTKFLSGILSSQSCMMNLEIPYISVMSKIDMLPQASKRNLDRYLETENLWELCEEEQDAASSSGRMKKFSKLTSAICQIVEDYSLVTFLPLDISEKDTIADILQQVDMTLQWDEDAEVREKEQDEPDE